MKLGGPVFADCPDPAAWVAALRAAGYSAAYCPVDHTADDATVNAYAQAAAEAGIVIAEVGAWSNPLSPEEGTRRAALELCQNRLALADRIGARCCVNIAGSRGDKWDGPCAEDLTEDTFDAIVETTRQIIDAVRPTRSFYSLETMPWMYPDSADSYVKLMEAIARPGFAVHFDPANLINCPARFFNTGAVLRECFEKLGPHIRSCHGKDITLSPAFLVHLDEVCPGLGGLDYAVFLRELSKLDPDTPLMLEHLTTAEEYALGAAYVRGVATQVGLEFG